jgi:hypothetical protein
MRFTLPRLLVSVLLLSGLLVSPLPAAAAPWGAGTFNSIIELSWGAFVGWTDNLVRHSWTEEGGSLDPLGRPAGTAPAVNEDGGRHLWAEEGASCDPLGRPAACASGMTREDGRQ